MVLLNATHLTFPELEYPTSDGYFSIIGKPLVNIYASLLLLIGIPGNIISAIIMGRPNGNRPTTRFLMITLSVADTAVLLIAVSRYWLINVLNWDPRSGGPIACKTHSFAVAFSTDFAVGALCAIAVERFIVVAAPYKSKDLVKLRSVVLGLTCYALIVTGKNLSHFWTMGVTKAGNSTSNSSDGMEYSFQCAFPPEYQYQLQIFLKIDLISFAVLPYIILFSSNLYIYVKLKRQQGLLQKAPNPVHRQTALSTATTDSCDNTRTVIVVVKRRLESTIKVLTSLTVIHVVCTLPGTIYIFICTYSQPDRIHPGLCEPSILKVSLVMLVFTNNAINVFGYYIACPSFRKGCTQLFCGRFQ